MVILILKYGYTDIQFRFSTVKSAMLFLEQCVKHIDEDELNFKIIAPHEDGQEEFTDEA